MRLYFIIFPFFPTCSHSLHLFIFNSWKITRILCKYIEIVHLANCIGTKVNRTWSTVMRGSFTIFERALARRYVIWRQKSNSTRALLLALLKVQWMWKFGIFQLSGPTQMNSSEWKRRFKGMFFSFRALHCNSVGFDREFCKMKRSKYSLSIWIHSVLLATYTRYIFCANYELFGGYFLSARASLILYLQLILEKQETNKWNVQFR